MKFIIHLLPSISAQLYHHLLITEFEYKIVGGSIPREYIPSVDKGVKSLFESGVVAGYPVVDVKVVLKDGSFHNVDSSDVAFQVENKACE